MAKEVTFTDGTVVASKFLNDVQQGLTGGIAGAYLAPHASDVTKLALSPGGHEDLAPVVLSNGTGAVANDFLVGFKAGAQNSAAASGGAGERIIWASTTSAMQVALNGDYAVSINEAGSPPANTFQRKLGTATWNGSNLLTNVRLTNGVMANADQRNSFIFRTVMDAAGDIPLTLAGRNGQSAATTKMLSVGYDVANVYGEKWSLSSTGLVKTKQAVSTAPHYQAFVTTDAQPQMSLLGSATGGVIHLGVGGATAVDVTIARSAVGVVKITDTVDVISIQNSTGSGALAGAVNILDALNVVGTGAFSGALTAPTAAVDTNTTQVATTAFVLAQLSGGAAEMAVSRLADGAAYDVLNTDADGTTVAWVSGLTNNHIHATAGIVLSKLAAGTAPAGTYAFGSATLTAATQTAADNSTKVATTAYVDTADALKANLASPTFTGTPTLPTGTIAVTQSAADSTTKVATTAFVTTADDLKANLASPTFTGTPTLPTGTIATTQSAGDSTTKLATTAFVTTADNLKANLASPTFTGTPTLPTGTIAVTQAVDDNTTKVATTAYVIGQAYLTTATASSTYAPLASPTFTGTPTLPTGTISTTQTPGDNTTKVASTAFVTAAVAAGGAGDASTTVKGVTKVSVAPVLSTSPISVGDNDARVTADQAAGTASIRTLGTGALQAAVGSHVHAFSVITGTVGPGQYAAGSIANADVNASAAIAYSKLNLALGIVNADVSASAAIAYSKLALTGAILNADLAGSIAFAKLSSPVGSFAMNSQKFTGLAAGSGNGDSVRYEQHIDGLALKANAATPAFTGTMTSTGPLNNTSAAGTTRVFSSVVTADSFVRFEQLADGKMTLGPGNVTGDVTLYRSAVGGLTIVKAGAATRAFLQIADAPVAGDDLSNKTYVDTGLALKANALNAALTGVPTAPTAAVDTGTTQLATTLFVVNQGYAKLDSPEFIGTPTLPTGTVATTQAAGNNSTKVATTAFASLGSMVVRAITASTGTIVSTDRLLAVSYNGATVISLPAISPAGKPYTVADSGGYCSATNTITLDPSDGALISGDSTFALRSPYDSITVVSDGTNWVVV